MLNTEPLVFALDNFEGPIDFLYYLVNKKEVDLSDIKLKKITEQYLLKMESSSGSNIETGAEFLGTISLLLWLKSRLLIPQDEVPETIEDHSDPHFEIIHQLIEYCRFKEAGKELQELEQRQNGCFMRGTEAGEAKRTLGIEHLSLDDLSALFKQLMQKAVPKIGKIQREVWQVADKIPFIRKLLKKGDNIAFEELFSVSYCREELIVTFLALLELMKLGEVIVGIEEASQKVVITSAERE